MAYQERDDLYQTANSEAGKHYEEELEINGFPQVICYDVFRLLNGQLSFSFVEKTFTLDVYF